MPQLFGSALRARRAGAIRIPFGDGLDVIVGAWRLRARLPGQSTLWGSRHGEPCGNQQGTAVGGDDDKKVVGHRLVAQESVVQPPERCRARPTSRIIAEGKTLPACSRGSHRARCAQSETDVAQRRGVVPTIRGPRTARRAGETAAARHSERGGSFRHEAQAVAGARRQRVGAEPVGAPFPDVAVHVVHPNGFARRLSTGACTMLPSMNSGHSAISVQVAPASAADIAIDTVPRFAGIHPLPSFAQRLPNPITDPRHQLPHVAIRHYRLTFTAFSWKRCARAAVTRRNGTGDRCVRAVAAGLTGSRAAGRIAVVGPG
jgi:hypothetical protein